MLLPLRSMKQPAAYIKYTWFILIFVFVVILAGGIVRTTQSGMGCPDWPTCFGRWIPPTSADQLPPDFEKYLRKQDIDHSFNVYHTWIESINRYLGALLGVFIIIHTIWSYRIFKRTRPAIFYLSLFLLLLVAFQGWLGKKVVDTNLAVVKITIHMLVALLIAAVPVLILARLRLNQTPVPRSMKMITAITLVMVIIQIVLGTEVREQIDEISRSLSYQSRGLWIARLDNWFLVHRSFSWMVTLTCVFLWLQSRRFTGLQFAGTWVLFSVVIAITAGLIMNFLEIPAYAQPIHLMAASILCISIFSFRLRMK